MGLLTMKEAARVFSEGLGRTIRPYDVEEAIEQGRLQGERGTGRRARYLVSEEEVSRLLEEHRRKAALEEGMEKPYTIQDQIWDTIPNPAISYFWRIGWRPRRRRPGRPPVRWP